MGISVVLLAANEAENLQLLLPRINTSLEATKTDFEILVIDSMQTSDSTPQVCSLFPSVQYRNQEEPRYAGAFRTGIRYAKKEFLIVLDADGSHTPEKIPELYSKIQEGYDLVIGSRYCKGGKTKDSRISLFMSMILNSVMRLIVGVRAKDISTSFRIYRTEQIKSVSLACQNYEVLQEVILRMRMNKKDFSIAELPITFEKRLFGQSKRRLLRFIFTYIRTIFLFLGIRLGRPVNASNDQ